jgi:hypothetical protein
LPFAADQPTRTLPFEGAALVRTGALGTAAGVADKAFEAGPVPTPFVAVTVNV